MPSVSGNIILGLILKRKRETDIPILKLKVLRKPKHEYRYAVHAMKGVEPLALYPVFN